jgi:uncharacterized protein (DUF427 family)
MTDAAQTQMAIEPFRGRVRASFANHIIADTDDALVLREGSRPPVYYFPVSDVEMGYLGVSDRKTHCPLKGDATYYSIRINGEWAEDVVWTYQDPKIEAGAIAGRVAFDTSKVEVYEIDEADIDAGLGHAAARQL